MSFIGAHIIHRTLRKTATSMGSAFGRGEVGTKRAEKRRKLPPRKRLPIKHVGRKYGQKVKVEISSLARGLDK